MSTAPYIMKDAIGPAMPLRLERQPEIQIRICPFDVSHYQDALFSHYGVTMPIQLLQAVPKRRCEYLAGRVLFHQLLHEYQQPPYQLHNTLSGAPLWPEGYVGSISHADGNALCCLMPDTFYQAIGIDIETLLSPDSCAELAAHIVQAEEQRLLLSATDLSFTQALTIAFSAKESLYKALYPQVQRFFGFEDAQLVQLQTDLQQFTLQLTTDLTPQLTAGSLFHGHYCFFRHQLISVIVLAQP